MAPHYCAILTDVELVRTYSWLDASWTAERNTTNKHSDRMSTAPRSEVSRSVTSSTWLNATAGSFFAFGYWHTYENQPIYVGTMLFSFWLEIFTVNGLRVYYCILLLNWAEAIGAVLTRTKRIRLMQLMMKLVAKHMQLHYACVYPLRTGLL